jgi:hypothetical protein
MLRVCFSTNDRIDFFACFSFQRIAEASLTAESKKYFSSFRKIIVGYILVKYD